MKQHAAQIAYLYLNDNNLGGSIPPQIGKVSSVSMCVCVCVCVCFCARARARGREIVCVCCAKPFYERGKARARESEEKVCMCAQTCYSLFCLSVVLVPRTQDSTHIFRKQH